MADSEPSGEVVPQTEEPPASPPLPATESPPNRPLQAEILGWLQQQAKEATFWQYLIIGCAVVIAVIFLCRRWEPWVTVIAGTIALVFLINVFGQIAAPRYSHYFWGALVLAAVLVYAASLAYQAGAPARWQSRQMQVTRTFAVNATPVTLAISFPAQAPLQAIDQPGLPIFVYLQGVTITPTATPTATQAPSATPAVTATVTTTASIATATPTPLPTFTSTPTPTPTPDTAASGAVLAPADVISITLAFRPRSSGLVFTDEKGVPVMPQIVMRAAGQSSEPAALYVRRASDSATDAPVEIGLMVQAGGEDAPWQTLPDIAIGLESPYAAWWRRFWGLLLGPATPILALVGTLIGFGWQWWQGERQKREERLSVINQTVLALREDLASGVLRYNDVRNRAKQELWPEDLLARLDECRKILKLKYQQLVPAALEALDRRETTRARLFHEIAQELADSSQGQDPLLLAIKLALAYSEPESEENYRKIVEDLGAEKVAEALVFGAQAYPGRAALIRPLAHLVGQEKYIEAACKAITGMSDAQRSVLLTRQEFEKPLQTVADNHTAPSQARELAKAMKEIRDNPRPWLRDYLWRSPRPEDPPEIKNWLGSTKALDFNPFGPERAELDDRLPDFVVPDVFSGAKGRRPVLVFGAPGAGRTAAALTLAYDCANPLLEPRESETFPVYYVPPLLSAATTSEHAHLCCLSAATSRWLCKLITAVPKTFLEMSDSKQACLVDMLITSLGSWNMVAGTLRRANTKDYLDHVFARMQRLAGDITTSCVFNRDVWPELVMSAVPQGFRYVYILIDIPSPPYSEPEGRVAQGLAPLVELADPLAEWGIYLKLFVPAQLAPYISLPISCQKVSIRWEEAHLRNMLKGRFQRDNCEVIFNELFDSALQGDNPETMLFHAALGREDAPRHLVRLGNALLADHAKNHPEKERFNTAELKTIIEKLK